MQETIKKLSCEKCAFAQWDDDTQVGCSFHNRLETFKDMNLAHKVHKLGKEFYEIDRFCNAYCVEDADKESVDDRIIPTIDYIVVHNSATKKELLDMRVNEIRSLKLKPQTLYIIVQADQGAKEIYERYADIGCKLLVISSLENLAGESAACIGMAKSKSRYCSTFSSAEQIPYNLIETLNDLINHQLVQVLCIKPENGFHGATIAGNINKVYKNNIPITDRINEVLSVRPDLVQQWK